MHNKTLRSFLFFLQMPMILRSQPDSTEDLFKFLVLVPRGDVLDHHYYETVYQPVMQYERSSDSFHFRILLYHTRTSTVTSSLFHIKGVRTFLSLTLFLSFLFPTRILRTATKFTFFILSLSRRGPFTQANFMAFSTNDLKC